MFTKCRVPGCTIQIVGGDNCDRDGVCGACTRIFEQWLKAERNDLYMAWLATRLSDNGAAVLAFTMRSDWLVAIDEWLSNWQAPTPERLYEMHNVAGDACLEDVRRFDNPWAP